MAYLASSRRYPIQVLLCSKWTNYPHNKEGKDCFV
ncbi:BZ3500_MvSof-1268-A1-R1_Chr8-1g09894 [Microbotryum saponariae]|uniref:BZ3500_MvSof-1268-A1-R1_Chr8-1g09894 protein n=1 Tax=Microbotryum saponariae TaxID=289078 RepID=A0A2X0KVP9_9BASI|nr:BZ3500_MvSof-1268-A1-R1_Chr8-1g09894 [Microbotryum saponariae]SDA08180.1 BZ3501_MvSof-1269-A2-R1_Chr8-1g09617 [Microbotryum saponariae]